VGRLIEAVRGDAYLLFLGGAGVVIALLVLALLALS
jgi:hypothetical protein